MSEARMVTASGVRDLDAADVLARVRTARAAENAAAAQQLQLAATWADLHPPESIHHEATFTVPGSEHEEPIAGQGCPAVAEFCVAELGAVLGVSTTAAKRLMGHALELRHRLPRLWAKVHTGEVPAWRARQVADATIHAVPALTVEAAGWVDSQVAGLATRVGPAQLDRLVAEAITRHRLAEAVDPDDEDWVFRDRRHVTIDTRHVHYTGTMRLEADLDLADALDVDRALAHRAEVYKQLGSTESLDARRARALGDLARSQTALDLAGMSQDSLEDRAFSLPPARRVVLHAHFDATALESGQIVLDRAGRLEEGQRLVLLEQVKGWCADTLTEVVITPVIDLNTHHHTDAYAIPDRMREQAVLRDRTCVFPWCTRPARGCQIDHVIPHDPHTPEGRPQPGPTVTDNLAPLCTRHHRLKTHSSWTYAVTRPGTYEWTSPHRHRYRRDPTGTTPLDPPPTPPAAPPRTPALPPPSVPRPRRRPSPPTRLRPSL